MALFTFEVRTLGTDKVIVNEPNTAAWTELPAQKRAAILREAAASFKAKQHRAMDELRNTAPFTPF